MDDPRLVSHNPETGVSTLFHYDPVTDEFTLEDVQDVESGVTLNREFFKDFDERANWKGDLHLVASIPLVVYRELERKGITPDKDAAGFRKWLNDPDNRFFRTRPGRV